LSDPSCPGYYNHPIATFVSPRSFVNASDMYSSISFDITSPNSHNFKYKLISESDSCTNNMISFYGSSIAFDQSGSGTITISYNDILNSGINVNGNTTSNNSKLCVLVDDSNYNWNENRFSSTSWITDYLVPGDIYSWNIMFNAQPSINPTTSPDFSFSLPPAPASEGVKEYLYFVTDSNNSCSMNSSDYQRSNSLEFIASNVNNWSATTGDLKICIAPVDYANNINLTNVYYTYWTYRP
jgi:hypothetical protein